MKDVVIYRVVTLFDIYTEGKLTTKEMDGKKSPEWIGEKFGTFYNLAYGKRQWVMSKEKFKENAYQKFEVKEKTKY